VMWRAHRYIWLQSSGVCARKALPGYVPGLGVVTLLRTSECLKLGWPQLEPLPSPEEAKEPKLRPSTDRKRQKTCNRRNGSTAEQPLYGFKAILCKQRTRHSQAKNCGRANPNPNNATCKSTTKLSKRKCAYDQIENTSKFHLWNTRPTHWPKRWRRMATNATNLWIFTNKI